MHAVSQRQVLIWGLGLALGGTGLSHAQANHVDEPASALTVLPKNEPCKLVEGPPDRMSKAQVAVGCGRFGVILGSGEAAEGQTDAESGAIVVKLVQAGATRVFLVTPRADGRPLLEDLTGDLAVALGRRSDRGLAGATIDLTKFATAHEIRVTGGGKPFGSAKAIGSTSIRLGAHLTPSRNAPTAPSPQPNGN